MKVTLNQRKTLYKGFFRMDELLVQHELFEGGMSPQIRREIMVRPQAACVLLFDPIRDEIVMVEQFRAPAIEGDNPWLLELVAGLVDKEMEQLEEVARRETEEEAGLVVKRLEKITQYWSSPGASNEYVHIYVGEVDSTNAGGIHGLVDEGEDIRVVVLSVVEMRSLLHKQKINNAAAIIAIQWFELNHTQLKSRWLD